MEIIGGWAQLDVGLRHNCAIRVAGAERHLYCWGEGANGRLGLGDIIDRRCPTRVGIDTDWESVSTGDAHSCALKTDGSLWCWGQAASGQLGNGSSAGNEMRPIQIGEDTDWDLVWAGAEHTCALKTDRTAWCWGRGTDGRLGLGSTAEQTVPAQVGEHDDWVMISAGGAHTCAPRYDARLWCWGNNADGQIGIGDRIDRDEPARICF
jgi:alpha-tubulin suppressor-like RCC1 family protein